MSEEHWRLSVSPRLRLTALTRLRWHTGGVACSAAQSRCIPKAMPRCTPQRAWHSISCRCPSRKRARTVCILTCAAMMSPWRSSRPWHSAPHEPTTSTPAGAGRCSAIPGQRVLHTQTSCIEHGTGPSHGRDCCLDSGGLCPWVRPLPLRVPPAQRSTLSRGSLDTLSPSPRPAPWQPGTLRRCGTAGLVRGVRGAGRVCPDYRRAYVYERYLTFHRL